MAEGWTAYANTHLQDICPPNNYGGWGYNFATAADGVLNAWDSATFDSRRNRMIFWGGGHGDYSGNELYALYFDDTPDLSDCLDTTGGRFGRITNPGGIPYLGTGYVEQEGGEVISPTYPYTIENMQPNSRHTYGGVVYASHADKIWGYAGSLAKGTGGGSTWVWDYNCSTKTWTKHNPTGTTPHHGGSAVVVLSQYDPVTHLIYVKTDVGFYSYNIDTQAWMQIKDNDTFLSITNGNCVLDPVRRRFLIFPAGSATVYWIDLTTGTGAIQVLSTTGTHLLYGGRSPGLAYDNATGLIVGWYGASDRTTTQAQTIYTLNQSTTPATWSSHGPYTGYPSSGGTGIYGRWQYVQSLNAFAVCTSWTDDCYVYELPASTRQVSIASNTWIPMQYNIVDKGAVPARSKHMRLKRCPVNGKIYYFGGDHGDLYLGPGYNGGYMRPTSNSGMGDSGRQDMYCYRVRDDTWNLEQPYWVTPPDVQPHHPDEFDIMWDSKRNIFWAIPGYVGHSNPVSCLYYNPSGELAPIYHGNSDCPEKRYHVMTYAALGDRKWTDLRDYDGTSFYWFTAGTTHYDAKNDVAIQLAYYSNNWRAKRWQLVSPYGATFDSGISAPSGRSLNQTVSAFDDRPNKRHIYFIPSVPETHILGSDPYWVALWRYVVDTGVFERVADYPSQCNFIPEQEVNLQWNPIHNVVHYIPHGPLSGGWAFQVHTYHPDATDPLYGTWEAASMTNSYGYEIGGRESAFDPYQNVLILHGRESYPYVWLYRYSPSGEPPPGNPPSPPTNLRIVS